MSAIQRLIRSRASGDRPRGSLGRRLATVLLPLVLIPVIIMGTAGYVRARDVLKQQITEQMNGTVEEKLQDIAAFFQTREIRLQADANRSTVRALVSNLVQSETRDSVYFETRNELRAVLENLRINRSSVVFNHMLILEMTRGEILASTNIVWQGGELPISMVAEIPVARPSTIPAFDHPVFSPNRLAVLTLIPISVQTSGTPDAVLMGITSGGRVTELLEDIQRAPLVQSLEEATQAQALLALSPTNLVFIETNTLATSVQHPAFAQIDSPTAQSMEYDNLGNEPVLGSFAWLPNTGLGIVVELPQAAYLREINSLAPFSTILVVIAAIFSVVVVVLTSNRLLRPLTDLTEFAQRMSRGEWHYRVPEERNDEVGLLATSLNRMAEDLSDVYRSLEERVEERTRQVRTAAEVARVAISAPSMESLLRSAVELIKSQFGYYHVSIFLLDEKGEYANLVESTGDVGQALKARGHRLQVGSESVIGWVTANNQPRVASDVSQDPIHLKNEFLPETRAEAAVPLQVAGRVLGALDVQSTSPDAFQQQDLEILQTLADQLCAALQNARLTASSAAAAEQARLMSEVTRELSRLMDVEEVMQTTASALHKALGQPEIFVRLHSPSELASFYSEKPTARDQDK